MFRENKFLYFLIFHYSFVIYLLTIYIIYIFIHWVLEMGLNKYIYYEHDLHLRNDNSQYCSR